MHLLAIEMTAFSSSAADIKAMEWLLCKQIEWRLLAPTAFTFVELYLERYAQETPSDIAADDAFLRCMTLLDTSRLTMRWLEFSASQLAAASFCLAYNGLFLLSLPIFWFTLFFELVCDACQALFGRAPPKVVIC